MYGFMMIFMGLGLIVSVFLLSIFKGWVLTILWGWFIIPVFHLPDLNIVQAIGLCMVVQLIVPTQLPKTDKEKPYEQVCYTWLLPIMALGIGWMVKQFI